MRMCKEHWDELKKAISERGLDKFLAENGQQAASMMKDELQGKDSPDNFEPLLGAHWAIAGNAIEMGGIYLMQARPEGDTKNGGQYCPLCEAEDHGVAKGSWIKFAADEQLEKAKAFGLLK